MSQEELEDGLVAPDEDENKDKDELDELDELEAWGGGIVKDGEKEGDGNDDEIYIERAGKNRPNDGLEEDVI